MARDRDFELVVVEADLPPCRHRTKEGDGFLCGSPFLEMVAPTIPITVCRGCAVADKTCDDLPDHPSCKKPKPVGHCRHLGLTIRDEETGAVATRDCPPCGAGVRLKLFDCRHPDAEKKAAHPTTTTRDCLACPDFEATSQGPLPAPAEPQPLRPSDVRRTTSVADVVRLVQTGPPGPWPREQRREHNKWVDDPEKTWHCWPNVQEAHRILADQFAAGLAALKDSPRGQGRGVVIAGGGPRYFPSAWVAIRKLRHLGCRLPIQLWYLGDAEMDPYTQRLLTPLGVECVDARVVAERIPCRILCGWELKLYATAWCPFEEVVFLDADCAPLVDPETLFDSPPYIEHGSVFWPDFDVWELHPGVWRVFGLEPRKERAFESGQYLVHKRRCWPALAMALWYAEHSDFVFGHVYGDKECYHLGWRKVGLEYGMPVRGPGWEADCCIVQHHPDPGHRDTPVFLHRCGDKWLLPGNRVCALPDEELHHSFVRELARVWTGRMWDNPTPSEDERRAAERLQFSTFAYRRLPDGPSGFRGDERPLELLPGGRIGRGAADCERRWTVNVMVDPGGRPQIVLTLSGDVKPTVHFRREAPGVWRGRWLEHERCRCELVEDRSGPRMDPSDPGPAVVDMDVREESRSRDRDAAVAEVLAVLRKYGRRPTAEEACRLVDSSEPAFVSLREIDPRG